MTLLYFGYSRGDGNKKRGSERYATAGSVEGGGKNLGRKLVEQTTIRLPVELKEKLQQEAHRLGISFNALVIMFLSKGVQE